VLFLFKGAILGYTSIGMIHRHDQDRPDPVREF